MRSLLAGGMSLALVCGLGRVGAEESVRRSDYPSSAGMVTLGRPEPLPEASSVAPSAPGERVSEVRAGLGRPLPLVRAQSPDPPPFPGAGPPPPPPPPLGGVLKSEEPYNCGVVNSNADQGGFWSRFCDRFKKCWGDVTGSVGDAFQPGAGGGVFQSDHAFDNFISPVSNPFYFEDPRALTELRPIFIWQNMPSSKALTGGGNNYFLNLQGRLALTPYISITVNKLGWVWTRPDIETPGFLQDENGFGELHLGPKFTFIRNDVSNTLAAFGLVFEVPVGSSAVFQDTGDLSLRPYFSFGQSFWRSTYGTFNFLNTTGYSFSINGDRTDFLFSSFHLDYDVGNLHRIYPLIELNWFHYTQNGNVLPINFEGKDVFNFGSQFVAGHNELTLAAGARYKFSENLQFGIAPEFTLLGGGRRLDRFRLTVDMIWRY